MKWNKSLTCIYLVVMLYLASLVYATPSMLSSDTGNSNADDPRVAVITIDVEAVKISVSEMPAETKETFYRNEFGLSATIGIEPESIDKLVTRNITDREGFEKIVSITRLVEEVKRENLANELAEMDTSFVSRLSIRAVTDREAVTNQISSYLEDVDSVDAIELSPDKEILKSLFRKEINMSTFIDHLWKIE